MKIAKRDHATTAEATSRVRKSVGRSLIKNEKDLKRNRIVHIIVKTEFEVGFLH